MSENIDTLVKALSPHVAEMAACGGDLNGACEACRADAYVLAVAMLGSEWLANRDRTKQAEAWEQGFEDYGRYLGTGAVPNNRYRKE